MSIFNLKIVATTAGALLTAGTAMAQSISTVQQVSTYRSVPEIDASAGFLAVAAVAAALVFVWERRRRATS